MAVRSHRVPVRLSEDELERWREAAHAARLDVASFVRELVEEGLDRRELEREAQENQENGTPAGTLAEALRSLDALR